MPRRSLAPPAPRGHGRVWAAAAIALAALVVFFPLLGYGFVNYDDPVYVYENAQVRAGLQARTFL